MEASIQRGTAADNTSCHKVKAEPDHIFLTHLEVSLKPNQARYGRTTEG